MSETSNDITQQSPGGENHGEARGSDDTRMAAPSRSDVERGAAPAVWAPSELHHDDQQPRPEAAGTYGLRQTAEALGLPAETIDGARAWLAGEIEFTDQQLEQFDTQHQADAAAELRMMWGEKFVANFKTIDAYLDSLPGNAGAVFKQARDSSGRALANDPATLQRLLGAATANGARVVGGTVHEQIAAIEQTMRTDRAGYNRNENLQARYRELLTMRERAR